MDLLGQRLGNYRLVRLLGEGGYAQVYLGEHILLSTQAAIKVLHAQLSSGELERFCQEASVVAHLAHPNIVRLFEFDVAEGLPFLVMEYAPGGTLRQRHPESVALPLETIQPYVAQIAAALAYTHAHQLVHRDLKPDNLLIGPQQQVLLGDFGLAILAHSSSQFKPQEIIGTVAYMAPEQLQGKPCPASDQYALAVLVYEWLTGERPFTGSLVEVIAQHSVIAPRPLGERVPTISKPVEAVVLRALEKDPKARFPSVAAFASAFAAACQATAGSPLTPRPITARSLVTRPVPARQDSMLPAEPPHKGELLHPVPAHTLLATAEEAGTPFLSCAHADRLEPPRQATRGAFRWHRFHLLKLHVGLALLVLVLATGGGLVWQAQATHFQQTIITGTYVTSLSVGRGVDPGTQAVQGASNTFTAGVTVVLVVTIVGWDGYAEAQLRLGSALVDTHTWLTYYYVISAPHAPERHFSAAVRLTQVGSYRWEVDLNSIASENIPFADGSITFQVT